MLNIHPSWPSAPGESYTGDARAAAATAPVLARFRVRARFLVIVSNLSFPMLLNSEYVSGAFSNPRWVGTLAIPGEVASVGRGFGDGGLPSFGLAQLTDFEAATLNERFHFRCGETPLVRQ